MKELFYIKGDPTNPEGVKEALLEKYPNAENPCDLRFIDDTCYYCVLENKLDSLNINNWIASVIKEYGTEIFPKKQQEFEEKTMYQPIYKTYDGDTCEYAFLGNTIEEALSYYNACGYKEVKVKILKK